MKNKPIKAVLTAGVMLAAFNMSALALTLPVSEDTSTSGNANVAKSAGKDIALHVSAARQGLVRFEAGAFADSVAATDVSKARLVLYINSVAAPGALTLHRVTQDWSERGATVPAYDAKPLATIPASSVVAKQFIIVDVTAAVQAWLREPGTDFGFAIATSDGARVLLGAKEGPGAGHPAQLQIETGDAAGPFVSAPDDAEDAAEGGRTRASATAPIGNFVTNADIMNNSIKGKKLKAGSVTGTQLALETVTGANILDGSIATAELADGSVTAAKLAAGAVTIADGSITTAKLANASVTTAKLGSGAVTAANLNLLSGSVGIGTATPVGQLEVSSGTETDIFATSFGTADPNFIGRRARGSAAAPTAAQTGDDLAFYGGRGFGTTAFAPISSATMIFRATENFTDAARGTRVDFQTTPNGSASRATRMTIDQNGFVGIGTLTPGVPLDVVGTASYGPQTATFFGLGATNLTNSSTSGLASIRASGEILAGFFTAISDERIKNIQGRSDSVEDLRKLLGIEITDYVFKDVVEKGNRPQKRVIAQQVEKVFPQAVTKSTDVVPDIYKKAPIHHDWVELATDLKVGDRVRLISEKGHRAVHEVLEVEDGRFRTDFTADGDVVFVYGREVKDFRAVDYEAIAMLNVSATQQIKKEKDAEIAALQQRIAALEAKDKAREARLTRLEASLPAPAAGAVTASLKAR